MAWQRVESVGRVLFNPPSHVKHYSEEDGGLRLRLQSAYELSHPSRLGSQLAAPPPIAKHFLKCGQVKLCVRPGLVDYRETVASIHQFLNMAANIVESAKQEHSVRRSKICNSRNRNDGVTTRQHEPKP
jgi:hypothetical protein